MLNEDQANQKLVEHLLFLFRQLHRGAESHAIKGGFTVPQRIVMGHLVRYGDLSVKELSQKVGLSHSTISGIVDRLERKGLVMRSQNLQDRRITKVTTTDLGKKHIKMMPHQMFSGVVDIFDRAMVAEKIKILEGLAALRQLLDKEEEKQL
jgi:DNA-binding MarR family transcriptional regulator